MFIRKRKSIAVIRVPLTQIGDGTFEYLNDLSLKEDYHVVILFENIERVTIEILCK